MEGGAITINPRMISWDGVPDTEHLMPVLIDSTFSNNNNTHHAGIGALSIYDGFSYSNYPVKLTVTN